QDVKAAIRWLRVHAEQYGIDKRRVLIWGASAGGQLAALTATSCDVAALEPQDPVAVPGRPPRSSPAESDCVQAAITWYGVFDFQTLAQQRSSDSLNAPVGGETAEARYLGCQISTCAADLIAAAS